MDPANWNTLKLGVSSRISASDWNHQAGTNVEQVYDDVSLGWTWL